MDDLIKAALIAEQSQPSTENLSTVENNCGQVWQNNFWFIVVAGSCKQIGSGLSVKQSLKFTVTAVVVQSSFQLATGFNTTITSAVLPSYATPSRQYVSQFFIF